ncbi:hypothetical protein N7448_006792 [Penicillium atrosanguineum]|nr:hypothetical protein N7448_006792 [Penicillium atrosanguineum]
MAASNAIYLAFSVLVMTADSISCVLDTGNGSQYSCILARVNTILSIMIEKWNQSLFFFQTAPVSSRIDPYALPRLAVQPVARRRAQ